MYIRQHPYGMQPDILGFVSQEALSATVLAKNPIFVANNFFFGPCTGVGILITQYRGKQDHSAIKRSYGIAALQTQPLSMLSFTLK